MSRDAVELTLPGGTAVVLLIGTVEDILEAQRSVGSAAGAEAAGAAALALCRRLIRTVDGAPLPPGAWPFRARQTVPLLGAVGRMHEAPAELLEAARASLAVTVETAPQGERERWSFRIGDKVITLLELSGVTLSVDVLGSADREQGKPLAGQYRVTLEGLRRSIVDVDGTPPPGGKDWIARWPLTPAETSVVGTLWAELHGLAGEDIPTPAPVTG